MSLVHLRILGCVAGLLLMCGGNVQAQRSVRSLGAAVSRKPVYSSVRWQKNAALPAAWKYAGPLPPVRSAALANFVPGSIAPEILAAQRAEPAASFNLSLIRPLVTRAGARALLLAEERAAPSCALRAFPDRTEIDAVIFDLDGTLLDSLPAWEHSGSNFVRSQGLEPGPELDEELVALSLMDGARLIKARYHLDYSPEEILALTLRPIEEHYYTDILPMPGVPELLARLHAQGVKMAVATASDRELAERSLTRLGLRHYFEFIITCDEVGVGKSSPKVYEEALRRLGTAKAKTLVAEDALHALQTAHAAGFPTAAIEEPHSATQRLEKGKAATYYVFSYRGRNVFKR